MKSLLRLWQVLAEELASECRTSTIRDFKTVADRVEHEGLSFLTIVLPAFCVDLQKGLAQGHVSSNLFPGFRRRGGLPLFLGGFLRCVFDPCTGRLLDDPSIDCLFAVRQLTLLFGKILVPCSDARVQKAIDGYIECEKEVKASDSRMSDGSYAMREFRRISEVLFGDMFSRLDHKIDHGEIVPKHGPGAVADGLRGNAKYDQRFWTSRLERVFPFGEYALSSWRYHQIMDSVTFLEPGAEIPVKVITVPKTLKAPRIIAVEPTCMQYVQQGLMREFVTDLESSYIRDLIGFTAQEPNQLLACQGSRDGSLATLDLSEASDRVSNQHVRNLVHRHPSLLEGLDASRSRKADVPGYGVIRLAKFASMGSAVCFPVEAMVFLTLAVLGIQERHGHQFTRRDIESLRGKVRVYGDDIIVPTDCALHVTAVLETFGYRVNGSKSFWTGKFRESCGKDYYAGDDVSVSRCRRVFPTKRGDVPELISLVALRNQLYDSGLWKTAFWIDTQVEPILGHYPQVGSESSVLGWRSFIPPQGGRMCPDLQHPLVKGWVPRSRLPQSTASGEGILLKWFLKQGDEPFADRFHMERQGRPETVALKLRWAPRG